MSFLNHEKDFGSNFLVGPKGLLMPERKIIEPKASMLVNPYRFGSIINADVSMAISASTSMTLPSHVSGNYIVMFAYRDGNNNTPTVPGGWTAITATGLIGVNSNCCVTAYKVAASNAETSGTWTNATGLVCAVVRQAGAGPLGLGVDSDQITGTSGTNPGSISFQGLTLANSDGHSIVLGFGGERNNSGTSWNAATGMTAAVSGLATACVVGGQYTTTGVSSFSTRSAVINSGAGSTGYASTTVEITGAA